MTQSEWNQADTSWSRVFTSHILRSSWRNLWGVRSGLWCSPCLVRGLIFPRDSATTLFHQPRDLTLQFITSFDEKRVCQQSWVLSMNTLWIWKKKMLSKVLMYPNLFLQCSCECPARMGVIFLIFFSFLTFSLLYHVRLFYPKLPHAEYQNYLVISISTDLRGKTAFLL